MIIKQASILKKFKCTGAACPANCCRGWKIPIDDDICQKYLTEKGIFGFFLRFFLEKKNGLISFKSSKRQYRCPFWGLDRLCSIQKNHGVEYMPRVCVDFPRQLSNFGSFCEETIYLACPEAARLFLEQARAKVHFTFEEIMADADYKENTTNDDTDFLNYLLKTRDELIMMLNADGLSVDILKYAKAAQDKCLEYGFMNTGVNLGSQGFPLPNPLDYRSSGKKAFTLNASAMHTLFFKGFYHPSLKHSSPVLYQLCKKYIHSFYMQTKTNPETADLKLNKLMESIYDYVPDFDELMIYYYEYFLQKNFLDIYEDYCFLKHILLGMAQTQMLKMFVALYCKDYCLFRKKRLLSADELSLIIAVYERRAPQIEDALTKLISENYSPDILL